MALAATVCRYVVGVLFLSAGLAKLADRSNFEFAVGRYGLLSPRFVRPAALSLPVLELAAGALLILGLGLVYASVAVTAALVVFTVAIGINLARGESFDCGCRAGGAPRKIGAGVLLRNVVVAAMAVVAAIKAPPALALDAYVGGRSGALSSSDAVALLVAAAVGVLAITLVGEAFSLRRAVAARQGRGT
jgi:uncharacterized membrane protein YphA (DoxX/SURF4 family)